jgi:predicted metal-dependent hydrolase
MSTALTEFNDKLPVVIRKSKRAKRIRMTIKGCVIEVTLPMGRKYSDAEKFVEANRDWAIKHLMESCGRVPTLPQEVYNDLPLFAFTHSHPLIREINLTAVGKTFHLEYLLLDASEKQLRIETPLPHSDSRSITVFCEDPQRPPANELNKALREWLRNESREYLKNYVCELAKEMGVKCPERIRIGFQKTIWGSYSSSGTISLCAHLLFLPPRLLRHVIVHELCHTVYMNHGKEFHKMLKTFDSQCEINSADLKKGKRYLPEWLLQNY